MHEHKMPQSERDPEEFFEHQHPIMDDTMAHYASAKCLYCYDAPCISACPSGIDIPMFIRQIRTQNLDGAARTIYSSNYFGQICGQVCPTEVLCEGACVYQEQDQLPVEIGALQAYACDHAIRNERKLFDLAPENGKKVAIIGAGPAGIACACELRLLGYHVDIFEAKSQPSGLALHGTAPYKITNNEVLEEVAYLQRQFGFQVQYNHRVDQDAEFHMLEKKYDAIFLGVGLGNTRELVIPGEDLDGCFGATEFIESVKLDPETAYLGDRIVVIGGGNTAMDAAAESALLGAKEVTLVYRRSQAEMSGYDFEFEHVLTTGVKAIFNAQPVEVVGQGSVEGVKFQRTEISDGILNVIPNSEFTIECDTVIKATGQIRQQQIYNLIDGLETKNGIPVSSDSGQTTNPKYFVGGDALNGGAEVVNAAAEGKQAAKGIHAYLIDHTHNS